MNGIFNLEIGKPVRIPDYIINCSVCGKSFMPIDIAIVPTNYTCYSNDSYQRLCWSFIFPEQRVILCEHLQRNGGKWSQMLVHETNDILNNLGKVNENPVKIDQEVVDALNEAREIFNKLKEKNNDSTGIKR